MDASTVLGPLTDSWTASDSPCAPPGVFLTKLQASRAACDFRQFRAVPLRLIRVPASGFMFSGACIEPLDRTTLFEESILAEEAGEMMANDRGNPV